MAPHATETSILQSYLLPPASLPNILSFYQFQQLFPASNRSHPHVKTLYRDLQFLRSVDADVVRENIDVETRKSPTIRRELLRGLQAERRSDPSKGRKRKHEGGGKVSSADVDEAVDAHLFGPLGMVPKHDRYYNAEELLSGMETACEALEKEADSCQEEADSTLESLQETVGSLSDLRYGKFTKVAGSEKGGGLEDSVVQSLRALEQAFARPHH